VVARPDGGVHTMIPGLKPGEKFAFMTVNAEYLSRSPNLTKIIDRLKKRRSGDSDLLIVAIPVGTARQVTDALLSRVTR